MADERKLVTLTIKIPVEVNDTILAYAQGTLSKSQVARVALMKGLEDIARNPAILLGLDKPSSGE